MHVHMDVFWKIYTFNSIKMTYKNSRSDSGPANIKLCHMTPWYTSGWYCGLRQRRRERRHRLATRISSKIYVDGIEFSNWSLWGHGRPFSTGKFEEEKKYLQLPIDWRAGFHKNPCQKSGPTIGLGLWSTSCESKSSSTTWLDGKTGIEAHANCKKGQKQCSG